MDSSLSISPFSSLPTKISPVKIPRLNKRSLSCTFLKRVNEQPTRIWAVPNNSQGKRSSSAEIMMVDPLEAKRLAAKQLQEIQAKEQLRRRRRIEAINGAWAMIGLTAGLVIEGETGKSVLSQLGGYLDSIFSFFFNR
ncbi:uncharacterized protein LOC110032196 isoform X2 [Phalaenopsis equestris]|uniref:uncharacterized protein LOC110032196 isoform X2 n=1 Tax=Phalaenopsis equestris TaxID=78828 RepID=UPI0009E27D8B|nr:uncharacterized protein LOC110032196 isoform X2 [Phalaenopsis equestris]